MIIFDLNMNLYYEYDDNQHTKKMERGNYYLLCDVYTDYAP